MSAPSPHRLPRSVTPSAYTLVLEPDLAEATFSGTVTIDVDVHEATNEIVLNAADLVVTEAIGTDAGSSIAFEAATNEETQRLTLTAVEPLKPGALTLSIAFEGVLNDKLRGFYRSTYEDDEGTTHTIATTQFESTNARRAFPCWDEPDLKATFAVTLVVAEGLMAISSGPETGREPTSDGRVSVTFAPTMVMSTYLLAFVVGRLEATEPIDVDGVPLRIVHPPGTGHLTDFAIDAGSFSLRHFTEYFQIDYPGDKLDLVALPDFAFGAMENLGCVTFREALLLLDPDETTKAEQQRVGDVIAHEIAHMWFGDLVTMKWWNGIWLKEAFATFCEMHATNAWRPEWKRWDDFGLSRTQAFDVDSLEATRPIEFDVVSPDDAEAMYDVLTYEKGAAVVRMLEQFLGEEAFRDGIRSYLAIHAYSNTETHDLWDAIEAETGQPARQIMDSWIFQGGYPLVRIEQVSPTEVKISQQRFRFGPSSDSAIWSVPLVLVVGSAGTTRQLPVLLDTKETVVEIDKFDWVTGNANASGFYRVHLVGQLLDQAVAALAELSAVERYGLVDDAWAATVGGAMEAPALLDLVSAVAATETDVSVWQLILGILATIDGHLEGEAKEAHRKRSVQLINDAFVRVAVKADDANDQNSGELTEAERLELRAALLETGGVLGDAGHIGSAREILDADADPAHSAAAVRVVSSVGSATDFVNFVERYQSAETPQEKRRFLFSLPRFKGDDEIQAFLGMLDREEVRSQDGAYVLGHALANNAASLTAWNYVEANWDAIGERYPDNSISRMIEGVRSIGDAEVADKILAFFGTHEVPQAGKSLDQHLERMQVSVALRQRLRAQLAP